MISKNWWYFFKILQYTIKKNMPRALVAFLATLCLYYVVPGVSTQPTQCQSDAQCQSEFYCVPDAFVCRRCLDCEQFKRNPPRSPVTCIKSIIECGSCIEGLEEDRSDGSNDCVLPDAQDDHGVSTYVWVVIVIILILFVPAVIFVVYLLRNKDTFKILASMRTSVQRPFEASASNPSAPEPPPPYYSQYTSVRPSSPENPAYVADYDAQNSGEDSSPFIKPAPFRPLSEARESAGNQAARVYNNPNYVRGPQHPYGNDMGSETVVEESVGPNTGVVSDDERDREPYTHDEDTMESTWTPSRADDNGNTTTGNGGSPWGLLPYTHSTHSSALCARQDTNNNRNASDPLGAGDSGTSTAPTLGPSFIINVVQNINALQQQNDK